MFNNKQGVIYLDRIYFDYFDNSLSASIRFDFSPYVTNLEITNREELQNQLRLFIENNKLLPSNIVVILSENVLFVKGVPEGTENLDEEIEKFSDNVPFERVNTKSYKLDNGTLLVATNKDLYSSLQEVFEKKNFSFEAIIPIYNAGINTPDPNYGLDPTAAKTILSNLDNLKASSLEMEETSHIVQKPKEEEQVKNKNKKNTYLLLGVFGFLLIVLTIVAFSAMKPEPKKTVLTPTANTTKKNLINTKSKESSQSATLNEKNIKIEIASYPGDISADVIRSKLLSSGFINISINKNPTTNSPQTLVVFSSNISETVREEILKEVKSVNPSALSQETINPLQDVLITLAKQN